MKNLFIIEESEKNRILSMHENATKKQYLTEQLTKEQALAKAKEMMDNGPELNEPGAKYCFTKEFLAKQILNQGAKNIGMYKIKSGDTIGEIKESTGTKQELAPMNPDCNWDPKKIRANDIILYSMFRPN